MAFKMKAGKEGPFYKNFPDLNKDGDITQADVLMGRGVFKKYKSDAQRKAVHASKAESGLKKTVSWKYGDGTYSGTLIPSMETKTHRYARTHNGKIKSLPKNK
jgi:hypothetical protein